jgi:hypothetical protein
VLDYAFGVYRVQPIGPISFARVNAREAAPPDVGGAFHIASFNVLNYFNGDGLGGGFPTSRGATTPDEFIRQRAKIIAAITALDADVIGLMEIENDGYGALSAIQDLVNGLNDAAGAGAYAFVDPGVAQIGGDEIAVGLIYRPSAVSPVGAAAILDSSVDPLFNDDLNRPALAQTFVHNATGETFTVAVNHLKSKGSACDAVGDPDLGDGQGNCNLTRTAAAVALVNWLTGGPTGSGDADAIIIGDLNAYAMEDPITAIKAVGYTNLLEQLVGSDAYSYVFEGQAGYLDHALTSPSLTARVTGAAHWHINADEPTALDYNDYNQPDLYSADPYRSSDHDPVRVGFAAQPVTAAFTPSAFEVYVGDAVNFVNTSAGGDPLSFLWDFGDGATSAEASPSHSWSEPGAYLVTLTASHDLGQDSASVEIIVRPRTASFETFIVRHADIHWSGSAGYFQIAGQMALPEGYDLDDLTGDLELTLAIGGESGSDSVSATDYGWVWRFRGSPASPVEGVEITQVLVVWPCPHSSHLPAFILRGQLSLPGVDHTTRPAEADVILRLPVSGASIEGVVGAETIAFRPLRRLWLYQAR